MILLKRLNQVLHYDPHTGIFTWLVATGSLPAGRQAGSINSSGHRVITIDGETYRAHALAWFMMTGHWPRRQVDHRNCVKDDNRWANLRLANNHQNGCNRAKQRNNSSGYKGVYKNKQKWRAKLQLKGRTIHLGSYASLQQAALVYNQAALKHFGEFAHLNQINLVFLILYRASGLADRCGAPT
jgi:hypothetical protein